MVVYWCVPHHNSFDEIQKDHGHQEISTTTQSYIGSRIWCNLCVYQVAVYCSPMLPYPAQCSSWNSANKTWPRHPDTH